MAERALVIAGPTASGKSAVAVEVAQRIDGALISFDSRQVYRGMDIGTAKPSIEERRGVPHFGFDLVDPGERYSAGAFARAAWRWIDSLFAAGRVPILAGGTGFFLRALTHPMFDEPDAPPVRREALKRWLRGLDDGARVRWAAALDPAGDWPARPHERQRAARAIEVALLTGRPLGWWHEQPGQTRALEAAVVVLDVPRAALYERINARVDAMIEAGLVDEVRSLVAAGYDEHAPAMNATGYAELLPYVRGETTLEGAVDAIRRASRRYARRQITWLRHQLPDGAVWIDGDRPVDAVANDVVAHWKRELT